MRKDLYTNDMEGFKRQSVHQGSNAPPAARPQGGECSSGQIRPREPRRPQPDATTLRGSASFAVRPASVVSVPPPGGFTGKHVPQIILKTDERKVMLELGVEGNSPRNQGAGTISGSSSKATRLRSRSRTAARSSRICRPSRLSPSRSCTTGPTTSDTVTATCNDVV